jgi:hypothetical protein
MFLQKYSIGPNGVKIIQGSNDDEIGQIVGQKLGLIYETQLLDPTMTIFFPIGPLPLSLAKEE